MTKTEQNKTEKLEDSINKIITANLQPFGTRMGNPSYVYTGKGDEATQILKACQKAGLVLLSDDQEPKLPTQVNDFIDGWRPLSLTEISILKSTFLILKGLGWKKTEEIEWQSRG